MELQVPLLQLINPLLKLVKQREQLYFELLSFVNKHIESSSNDLDNVTVFNRFMSDLNQKNVITKSREQALVASLIDPQYFEIMVNDSITKEMLRFSSRLIEMLQASMAKIRKSIFDEQGRVGRQFVRFRVMIHKILKRKTFNAKEYCEYIIKFTNKKYIKQLNKLQKYLEKIELGQEAYLKNFYMNVTSDNEPSSEQKKPQQNEIPIRRIDFKLEIKQMSPEKSHQKKNSLKKTIKPSTKRQNRTIIRRKTKQKGQHRSQNKHKQMQQKPNKEQTANKLLKFYNMLELSKKQFLEDYIYEQIEIEKHKQELFSKLVERNKQINSQIKKFIQKRLSQKRIRIVPPKKQTLHFESSSGNQINQKGSDIQKKQILEGIRRFNPRQKSSHREPRDTIQKSHNKKIYVVKAPTIFEDDMIPQAQMSQTQWLHMPNRYKDRRNENLRLKKKSNPNPMQSTILHDNFRNLM